MFEKILRSQWPFGEADEGPRSPGCRSPCSVCGLE
jgi:hypothetical protein